MKTKDKKVGKLASAKAKLTAYNERHTLKKDSKKVWPFIKDSFKMLLWIILGLILIPTPSFLAFAYESNVFDMAVNKMSKVAAAHYSNTINYAYNLAALATILIAYLMIKHLVTMYKKLKRDTEGDK